MTTKSILARWHAKARCHHTQPMADRLWKDVHPRLTLAQQSALKTAWIHGLMGEGWDELDREYLRVMKEAS